MIASGKCLFLRISTSILSPTGVGRVEGFWTPACDGRGRSGRSVQSVRSQGEGDADCLSADCRATGDRTVRHTDGHLTVALGPGPHWPRCSGFSGAPHCSLGTEAQTSSPYAWRRPTHRCPRARPPYVHRVPMPAAAVDPSMLRRVHLGIRGGASLRYRNVPAESPAPRDRVTRFLTSPDLQRAPRRGAGGS